MQISELNIRRAVPGDAPAIAALYAQLVSNPHLTVLPERIAAIADDPNTALWVGVCDGQVHATALVCLCADVMFAAQPFAVVENVVVDEALRARGVGARLFRQIEAFCHAAQCSKIMLLSSAHREEAHRFFERIGFLGSSKRGFVKYRRQFTTTP